MNTRTVTTVSLARVPWPAGNWFDLGCCGCLYREWRRCVLAVILEVTLYYELLVMRLIVAMCLCWYLTSCGTWLAREWFDIGLSERGEWGEPISSHFKMSLAKRNDELSGAFVDWDKRPFVSGIWILHYVTMQKINIFDLIYKVLKRDIQFWFLDSIKILLQAIQNWS